MPNDRLIVQTGPLAGEVFELSSESILLGRGDEADLHIDHPTVSRSHARIYRQEDRYYIQDLDSQNGTFVNDTAVVGPTELSDDDLIQLGPQILLRLESQGVASQGPARDSEPAGSPAATLLQPEPPDGAGSPVSPTPPSAEGDRLIITPPGGQPSEHSLEAERVTVGRLPDNDIVINIPTISRRHLTLRRREGTYVMLVRPDAMNPVFVNREPVLEQHPLSDGDQISIGHTGGELSVTMVYRAAAGAGPGTAAEGSEVRGEPQDPQATRVQLEPASVDSPEAAMTQVGVEPELPDLPPQLVVTGSGLESDLYTLTEERVRIGRHPSNDIVIDNQYVSRFHAEIERRGAMTYIVPAPSVGNPLVLDGVPVMEAKQLKHGAKMRIGGFDPETMVTLVYLAPAEEAAGGQQQILKFSESKIMSFGRHPDNDFVLEAPSVSRFHAQVERIGQRYRLRDLDSSNGTFVNGQPVKGETWVEPGNSIHIGPYRLVVGHEQLAQVDESEGGMAVDAYHLNKWVRKDLNILQDISLSFQPREFIVVVGQSGGGKSTLVDAISGYRPATHGRVIINNSIDVYKNFDAIRNTIGYVPQKDIIHKELTVFEALDFSARLRMPADTTQAERHQRIEEVLDELDLAHRRDTQIMQLSGGQQKRVSIGVELLTKPGLFFLDEPTSGLDPGMETELMQLMRRLADQGRTIVLITHATKNVMLADRVVFLARGGHLAWFGPPDEALTYFDQFRSERERRTKPIEFDDIYNLLDHDELGSGEDWAQRFREHEAHERYIPTAHEEEERPDVLERAVSRVRSVGRNVSALRQFLILSSRSVRILFRDRATLALMLLSAPLLAALDFVLAFGVGRDPFSFQDGDLNNVIVTLIVLINTSILVGGLSMMRELVREREIYKRERMVSLNLSSYVMSKLWFALVLALYQTFFFTLIRHLAFDMPGGPPEVLYFFITVFLMITAGMMMGLLSSGLAPNSNAVPLLLVMFILPQIVLSGALVPLPDALSAPATSRWAFQSALAISGVGSDVVGDACWTDFSSEERKELSREFRDENCQCMGINAVKQSSCNFPGLGQFYDAAVDAPDPVKPEEPGPRPEPPVLPEAPEQPEEEDLADPAAMQTYLEELEAHNEEVDEIMEDFNDELDAFEQEQEAYRDDLEAYQEELTELETDRASAVGSAEATIDRFYDDYGWTFVDKSDTSAYVAQLIKTWLAQTAIVVVTFAMMVVVQKRRDIR